MDVFKALREAAFTFRTLKEVLNAIAK